MRGDFCFLNSKTVGFKLEALEKLRQIKSNSGESIEQYVAHQVRVLNLVACCCECKNNVRMYVCMYACFCDDDGHKLISSEYVDALDILSDFPSLEQAMSVRYIQYPLIVARFHLLRLHYLAFLHLL